VKRQVVQDKSAARKKPKKKKKKQQKEDVRRTRAREMGWPVSNGCRDARDGALEKGSGREGNVVQKIGEV